jgi:hypothetical protein
MAKQGKVGTVDTARKEVLDKDIAETYKNGKQVKKESSRVSKQLKKLKNDNEIARFCIKLDDLSIESKNIAKELRKKIKNRVELFGKDDMPDMAEVEENEEEEEE